MTEDCEVKPEFEDLAQIGIVTRRVRLRWFV